MSSIKYKVKEWIAEFLEQHGWVDQARYDRLQYDYRTVVLQRNNYMDRLSQIKYVVNSDNGTVSVDNWDAFEKDTEELYGWDGYE